MKIAILGGGFSGLALAYFLSKKNPLSNISLFDPKGIGGAASGVAAGLLHPFAGAHCKLNHDGFEAIEAVNELLDVASEEMGYSVAETSGILRLAFTEEQQEDYLLCAEKFPQEARWISKAEVVKLHPALAPVPGLWMPNGRVIKGPSYLNGLWKACQKQNVKLIQERITQLSSLNDFQLVIAAMGAETKNFPELAHLSLTVNKGQFLKLPWPTHLPPIPFAVCSKGYFLMDSPTTCIVGSTYEKTIVDARPDIEVAKREIMPKVISMLPCLQGIEPIDCLSGLRAVGPRHLPLIQKINDRFWVLTGMGSKGLLYHALYAKRLVEAV